MKRTRPRPPIHRARLLIGASGLFLLFALLVTTQRRDAAIAKGESFVNSRQHDGEKLSCNFRADDYMSNIGGADGAGMCVHTSVEMSALWLGLEDMRGFRNWAARQPGGGYPEKINKQLDAWWKYKGIQPLEYIQYEGANPEILLDKLSATHRCAGITYGYSPRYSGPIAHMTVCPHFSGKWGVCLDNNPMQDLKKPDHLFEWMSREELLRRIKSPRGQGWVFAWTAPAKKFDADICKIFGPYTDYRTAQAEAREARRNGWKTGDPYRGPTSCWYFQGCR